jgi:hypothetical protein
MTRRQEKSSALNVALTLEDSWIKTHSSCLIRMIIHVDHSLENRRAHHAIHIKSVVVDSTTLPLEIAIEMSLLTPLTTSLLQTTDQQTTCATQTTTSWNVLRQQTNKFLNNQKLCKFKVLHFWNQAFKCVRISKSKLLQVSRSTKKNFMRNRYSLRKTRIL